MKGPRADAPKPAGAKPTSPPASPPATPQPPKPDPMLIGACVMVVAVVGNIVTARAGVDPLSEVERQAVGEAAANVAVQYDLEKLSPQAAAWLGLGVAVVGVAAPRVEQYRRTLGGAPAAPETPQAASLAPIIPVSASKPAPSRRGSPRRSRKAPRKPAVKKAA